MSDYDRGHPPGHDPDTPIGAPPIERVTARVNGTAIPQGLLVPDAWMPSLFVRLSLAEVSWFARVPVRRAAQVCSAATAQEPRVRHVVDRYFDTRDRELFGRRVSVRLRHHVEPVREIAYEIIAVGWGAHAAGGRLVDGFVQTFQHNEAGDIPRLLERFRAHGYEQVACFDKTRYTWELSPSKSSDARGKRLQSAERTGVVGVRGWLRVNDFGMKVDVDELHGSPFPEPSIVEVEYDPARRSTAAPLVERIRGALAGELREKEFNKIAHLLGGRM
ncbi:MAG TPA: CYTH domain-containing protein [Longimicrobium sp.]|nr:CYTH domain-containing protein [Longimicrobium sp.]